MMTKATAGLLLSVATAFAVAAPAQADAPDTQGFIAALDASGIHYGSPEVPINAGMAFCRGLSSGPLSQGTLTTVINVVKSARQLQDFIGDAVYYLCPNTKGH